MCRAIRTDRRAEERAFRLKVKAQAGTVTGGSTILHLPRPRGFITKKIRGLSSWERAPLLNRESVFKSEARLWEVTCRREESRVARKPAQCEAWRPSSRPRCYEEEEVSPCRAEFPPKPGPSGRPIHLGSDRQPPHPAAGSPFMPWRAGLLLKSEGKTPSQRSLPRRLRLCAQQTSDKC